jgi:hypothetical protein
MLCPRECTHSLLCHGQMLKDCRFFYCVRTFNWNSEGRFPPPIYMHRHQSKCGISNVEYATWREFLIPSKKFEGFKQGFKKTFQFSLTFKKFQENLTVLEVHGFKKTWRLQVFWRENLTLFKFAWKQKLDTSSFLDGIANFSWRSI